MAKLTRDDVLDLARLARLDLSEEEIAEFMDELPQLLAYVEQLQQLDTEGLQPTNQVSGLTNVTRDDKEMSYGYKPKDLLENVPEVKDDQIKVRRMVE